MRTVWPVYREYVLFNENDNFFLKHNQWGKMPPKGNGQLL